MAAYFLQVNICWLLFYGVYYALLSKETFFKLNRTWLIASLLCGLALPFVADYFAVKVAPTQLFVMTLEPFVVSATALRRDLLPDTEGVVLGYLAMGYALGAAVLVARFLAGLFLIFKLLKQSKREQQAGFRLVYTEGGEPPFSFFNFIFINPREFESFDYQQIMQHEEAHVRQRHSYDVVFLELLNIVFWCSPLIYFYKTSLRNVHEYLADEAVLRDNAKAQYGRLLLRQRQSGMALALTSNISNHFFSQLKKRILMMTRNKSKRTALIKYALAAPIFLILTAALASPKTPILAKAEALSEKAVKTITQLEKENLTSFLAQVNDNQAIVVTQQDSVPSNISNMKEGEIGIYFDNLTQGGKMTESEVHNIKELKAYQIVNGKAVECEITSFVMVLVPKKDDPQQENVLGSKMNEGAKTVLERAKTGGFIQFLNIRGRAVGTQTKSSFGSLSAYITDASGSVAPVDDFKPLSELISIDVNQIQKMDINSKDDGNMEIIIVFNDGHTEYYKGSKGEKEKIFKKENVGLGKLETSIKENRVVFTIVEENPEFMRGQAELFKWLGQNIQYPKAARENNIDGTVYVGFIVNEDGSISNVTVKRGIGGGCDQEAMRVVSEMPDWKPGKQGGKNVRVAYTLPIKFQLDKNNPNKESNKPKLAVIEVEKMVQDNIYTIVDQNPEFAQGQMALFKWLSQNIQYPARARQAGGQGTVYVGFVVETDGSISNVTIKRDVPVIVRDTVTFIEVDGIKGNKFVEKKDYSLGREAVRVISAMPKWKPGKKDGVAVRVAYTLPIKFKLE
jgi:TonB family protein